MSPIRPTVATVDLDAIARNVGRLKALDGAAALMAVVKANGYGHGSFEVATTALRAGATWLGVAMVEEAEALYSRGIDPATPIVVLSEQPSTVSDRLLGRAEPGLRLVVASVNAIDALSAAAVKLGRRQPLHLKVDTGMHRMGCDPADAARLVRHINTLPGLDLEGICTHFAVADSPDDSFTAEQQRRFQAVLDELKAVDAVPAIVHAANSAASIRLPETRYSLMRCGIAIYGVDPDPQMRGAIKLDPALTLRSEICAVREIEPGEGVNYGRRWRAEQPTKVATVPIGYADGINRRSGLSGVEVLVRGRRRPIRGVVTMDQLVIEVSADVMVGDEVVLIGSQGSESITVDEVAARLDTISYEILTSLAARLTRRYD